MTLRDFKIGWRLLISQPGYFSVVILGLSIGFAAYFLLLIYVRYSYSYENSIPDAGRIYFVKSKDNYVPNPVWSESAPFQLYKVVQQNDSVESVTPVVRRIYSYKVDNHVLQIDTLITEASIGQMFGIRVIEGNLQQALANPTGIALTASTAQKLFHSTNVIGEIAQVEGKPYVVGAVVADPPVNSTVYYESLAGIDSPIWSAISKYIVNGWSFSATKIYVKLKPGANGSTLVQQLQRAADQSPILSTLAPDIAKKLGKQKPRDIQLGALTNAYFENLTEGLQSRNPRGDKNTVMEFAAMAAVILLLAAANYVNLATVRTLNRQREIALRKVLGASIGRIVGQFMIESLIVAMISTGIGLVLTWLLLPLFSEFVDRKLDLQFSATSILIAISLGAGIGILAGAYPAWVALKVRATQTLTGRGNSETISGLWLRRVLTVLQFATAMGLTGVTLAMMWQTYFAIRANPGFDTAALLVVELPKDMTDPASMAMRDALKQVPGITGVIASADPLGSYTGGGGTDLVKADGTRVSVLMRPVSANFFETLGLQAVAGRVFDSKLDRDDLDITEPNVIVINQTASRALGYATPLQAVGQTLVTNTWTADSPRMESLRIVGVAPDIRLTSLHELTTVQLAYMPFRMTNVLTVKSTRDLAELESTANKLAQQYFPNDVIEIHREQSYLEQNYQGDLRTVKLLGIASLIALLIAVFGIYVLSTYNLQRLSKQIILRKLYGASHRNIASLVGREFIILITVAAIIGLPFAVVAIQRYLATYVEHAPIGGWTLMAALLLALLVTFVSTLRHTVIAMRLAPAQILRD